MSHYPEAYDADHLQELINANSSCPDIAMDEVKRLIDLAERRAQLRGEKSGLDDDKMDCVIATDWSGFASSEFGYYNGSVNQFALGVLNEGASAGKRATLFNDTIVIQNGWLQTGDNRRAKIEQYNDDEFEQADGGEMWIPHSAQDYIAIVGISNEMIHGEPSAADAM